MKHLSLLLMVGAVLAGAFAAYARTPLVVIRFNQRAVYFERPLYQAASQAIKVKPDVAFEVVGLVPDNTYRSWAEQKAAEVKDSLVKMGVPASRIQETVETGSTPEPYAQVHVYVR